MHPGRVGRYCAVLSYSDLCILNRGFTRCETILNVIVMMMMMMMVMIVLMMGTIMMMVGMSVLWL